MRDKLWWFYCKLGFHRSIRAYCIDCGKPIFLCLDCNKGHR